MDLRRVFGLIAVSAAIGCGTQESPLAPRLDDMAFAEQVAPDPIFLRFSNEKTIADSVMTFWAVKGENREVIMRFTPYVPGEKGDHFLRFKVPNDGLQQRPDGSPIQKGDSVQITVRVDPGGRFIFRFSPIGLVFNPDKPAELQIWYDGADPDFNDDGMVDAHDDSAETRLRLFRQPDGGSTWEDIGFVEFDPIKDQIKGEILHFTGFALAS